MIQRLKYNSTNINMIYNSLLNLSNQGQAKDFEIKIDGLTVVNRTNQLNRFRLYRKSMFETTQEVIFILYNGQSRVNDKYILTLQSQVINKAIDVEAEVDRIVKEELLKKEFKRLKEVEVYHKQKIKKLKSKIEELETQKSTDLKEILGSLGQLLPSNENLKNKTDSETQQLVDLINHYKTKCTKNEFEESLAIGLTLTEQPELIKWVKQFITRLKKENKNEKEIKNE